MILSYTAEELSGICGSSLCGPPEVLDGIWDAVEKIERGGGVQRQGITQGMPALRRHGHVTGRRSIVVRRRAPRLRGRGRVAKRAAAAVQRRAQYDAELAGLWDTVKSATRKAVKPIAKAGTAVKKASIKVGKAAASAAKKAARGFCKVAQNQAVQQGNQMAAQSPSPEAQGIAQGMAMMASFCESAYPTKAAEEAAAAALAADPNVQAAVASVTAEGSTNYTPWLIGGGVAALLGVGYVMTRKK